jgi:anti-sigma regulatory factor (Ser/Thr protein kinase)
LVERRRESLDIGLARLLCAARARVRMPIDQLADDLLHAMLADSDGTDDVVALLLRAPIAAPEMLLRKVHATGDDLRAARREVRTWLASTGMRPECAAQLLTAVGEACMNVVQHAYTDEAHRLIRLEGTVTDGLATVTITDTGTWKEHSARSVGGRGVDMMRRLVPDVEITRRPGGTSVTLRMPIGGAEC